MSDKDEIPAADSWVADVGKLTGVDARVGVGVGITLQTGQYTYVKPNVSIEVAVPAGVTPDEMTEFLTKWALDRLETLEEKLIEYAG